MEPPPERLDGWKAIAAYLGRDERTAQRWRERGLPVHTVPGGRRGTVFALTGEIDTWLSQQPPMHQPTDDAAIPQGADEPPASTSPPEAMAAETAAGMVPLAASRGPTTRRRWQVAAAALTLLALTAAALGTANSWRPVNRRPVGRAELSAAGLVVVDALGGVLFSVPVASLQPAGAHPGELDINSSTSRPVIVDLDGDGDSEVLVVLWQGELRQSEVRCYSTTGEVLWSYPVDRELRFADRTFDGPWRVTDRIVVPTAGGGARLWLSVIHDVWWPSFVISLDAEGSEQLHLTHSGHLHALQALETADGTVVLATGVNNEHEGAILAAMGPEAGAAVSPQLDETYTCADCPAGPLLQYFLFPKSELSRTVGRAYSLGVELRLVHEGVRVSVEDLASPERVLNHFVVSSDLIPSSVQLPDDYWTAHRRLEATGTLDHSADACPERTSRIVRVWHDDGWQDVEVPADTFAR